MTALATPQRSPLFSPDPLRSPTTQRYFLNDLHNLHDIHSKSPMQHDFSSRDSPSPVASTESSLPPSPNFTPTVQDPLYTPTLSSLSLDEELLLPSDKVEAETETETETETKDLDTLSDASIDLPSPSALLNTHPAADDTSVEDEPSRHVDYLAHEWKEEDIWASWRYVTARRGDYSNGVRLENASWRTWAKAKNNLGTISPETLNW